MATRMETIGIDTDEGPWNVLSRDVAESLLRVCALPGAEDRTYTNVNILPTPSGDELYMRSSFSG